MTCYFVDEDLCLQRDYYGPLGEIKVHGLVRPTLGAHHNPNDKYIVIIEDGSLEGICLASKPELYFRGELVRCGTGEAVSHVLKEAKKGFTPVTLVHGCHLWDETEVKAIHVCLKDFPLIFGNGTVKGLPNDLPRAVTEAFNKPPGGINFVGFFLIGLQADSKRMARERFKRGLRLRDIISAAHAKMEELASAWTSGISGDRPCVGVIGVGTRQMYLPPNPESAEQSMRMKKLVPQLHNAYGA